MFYIVATPIGNLNDFSLRAIETLKKVDFILCEDTRLTKKLLDRFDIETAVISYHQHSKLSKVDYIVNLLKEGKELALVTDAGTPGISDPGGKLIEALSTNAGLIGKIKIAPVPGPCALAAAASVSGFPMDRFLFLGFPPAKNKRRKFFEEIINSKYPVVFYESCHRIIRTLEELEKMFQFSGCKFQAVVCRELTKIYETIYRGTLQEILDKLKQEKTRGEFVVIVDKR